MEIKTRRIYEKPGRDDGRRVLVDRLWPRGVRKEGANLDEWMKEVAPSDELRRWFGHEPVKWAEFKKRYFRELAEKKELLAELLGMAKSGTVTLLFGARDPEHNNAVALKKYLERKAPR